MNPVLGLGAVPGLGLGTAFGLATLRGLEALEEGGPRGFFWAEKK